MGRAGKALKQVLEKHDISQYRLAAKMEIDRTNIYRWVHEQRDPNAETVVEIVKALVALDKKAANLFIQLFLLDLI
jgi:predicted transcriptional regulator